MIARLFGKPPHQRTVEDACPYKVCAFIAYSRIASSCLPRRGRGTTKWWKESPPCCGVWITDAQCAPLRVCVFKVRNRIMGRGSRTRNARPYEVCVFKADSHTAFSKPKPHQRTVREASPYKKAYSRRVTSLWVVDTDAQCAPLRGCAFIAYSRIASSCRPRRGRGTTKWWKESPPHCGSWITDAQCGYIGLPQRGRGTACGG